MGTSSADPRVVCDAGPLIHLHELTATDLLGDLSEVIVPESVWSEVLQHQPAALQAADVRLSRVPTPEAGPDLDALARGLALGLGEVAAISVARREEGCLLLTDDAAARLAAEGLGLRVHGTIGVILRSLRKARRTADQVVELLQAIPVRSSLHIRRHLLDEAIRRVKERGSP